MLRDLEAKFDGLNLSGLDWVELSSIQREELTRLIIGKILESISDEKREPDEWESGYLRLALRCLELRAFRTSLLCAQQALKAGDARRALPTAFAGLRLTTSELMDRLSASRSTDG
ncbi:hypothetical protein BH09PSE5_BH09PSE5_35530 [soil metagenome]